MAELLAEEVVNDAKENFALFDHDGNNQILIRDLGNVLRAMGQHPKESELQAIIADVDYESTGILTFEKFLRIVAKRNKETEDDDELKQAFKFMDKKGTGTIHAAELREILTTLGEKLDDDEVEELIRDADKDGDGIINFEEFALILMDK